MGKKDDVKSRVSVPMYFYNIIVPQLGSYYSEYPVDFDARPVACCPLHDEDTPSMRYYEETNTFYCFGCRRGGDVIALHRMFTERYSGTMPTMEEAVDFLYNYFIKGNEHLQALKQNQSLTAEQPKSNNVELARYCKYTSILEVQLSQDSSISDEAKRKIWAAMDNADILVDKNQIGAVDAMKHIQQVVREVIT